MIVLSNMMNKNMKKYSIKILNHFDNELTFKVEKILKGSLDSIPSPSLSVKIQIMGGKVCLRCKRKYCWPLSKKLLKTKKFV
jgi:hypothetical protein